MTDVLPATCATIAVITPTWLGDLIMATPLYRALRAARPDARCVAFVRRGQDVILDGAPWFDAVETIHPRGANGFRASVRAVRAARPDVVILLPNSFRTALLGRLSGAACRIGTARDARRILLTHALREDRPRDVLRSTIDDYRALTAFTLGCGAEAIDPALELHVTDAEAARARTVPGLDDAAASGPRVLIVPGGSKPAKRWPAERFAAVGRHLVAAHGATCLVSGAPDEAALTAEITASIGIGAIDLAAAGVDLGAIKALVRDAALVVTGDTGPRHLAAAFGTPAIALYGPTDHRWTAPPDPDRSAEITLRAEPFLPAELVADRYPKACAIEHIAVGDVIAWCDRQLGAGSPPGESD